PVLGTTGYDFLNAVNATLIDPSGIVRLEELYLQLNPRWHRFEDCVRESKEQVLRELFPAELRRLEAGLLRLAPRPEPARLGEALRQYICELPVYRTYLEPPSPPEPEDEALVRETIQKCLDRD